MKEKKSFNIYKLSAFYGIVFFLIGVLLSDIPGQHSVFSTVQDILGPSTYGLGDPISFMKAGLDFSRLGWVSTENHWIINLWPPGFMLLEALAIRTVGESGPIILTLQLMAIALYTLVMMQFYFLLLPFLSRWGAALLPLSIFLFPMTRVFLLQPTGIILGETFSIGFFLLGAFRGISSFRCNSYKDAAWAGVFFALSAYFRSQFEIFLLGMTFWWLVALMLNLIPGIEFKQGLKKIAVVLFFVHLTTAPWRVYHGLHEHSIKWVHTDSITFRNLILSDDELIKLGGGFVVEGGGNLVCKIDPSTCDKTENAKKVFVKTFFKHPFLWLSIKARIAPAYWFSPVVNWGSVVTKSSFVDYLINLIFLLTLVLSVWVLFLRSSINSVLWPFFLWINISVHSAYILIFTVQQFEVRYFYFYKIFGFFILIVELAVFDPKFLKKTGFRQLKTIILSRIRLRGQP